MGFEHIDRRYRAPIKMRMADSVREVRDEISRRTVDIAKNEIARVGRLLLKDYARLAWHVLEPTRVYKEGWHQGAICELLQAVEEAEVIRAAIAMPPGCMKSLLCSVFFPTHIWGPGGNPAARFLGFANDMKLSTRDAVKSRRLIESSWYRQLWGDRFKLLDDQNQKTRYENDQTGFRIADYVGGGTGERGDFITIDDPHEVADSLTFSTDLRQLERTSFWLHETLPSRVNDPETSGIVAIHHRIHQKDLIGDILKSDLGYTYLCLPMEYDPLRCSYAKIKKEGQQPEFRRLIKSRQIWLADRAEAQEHNVLQEYDNARPELVYKQDPRTKKNELLFPARFPRAVVDRDKAAMTTFAVNGQMQQDPQPREGTIIKRHWFEIVKEAPADCHWVRYWDLAATEERGAWTAGVLMGRSRSTKMFYIKDVKRERLEGDAVKKLIKQTAAMDLLECGRNRYTIGLPQDPGQAGKTQAKDYALELAGYNFVIQIESGSKEVRAQPFADQAEAGNVKLILGKWNDPYLDEAVTFPGGDYKDQIDGSSGAFSVQILNIRGSARIGSVTGLG